MDLKEFLMERLCKEVETPENANQVESVEAPEQIEEAEELNEAETIKNEEDFRAAAKAKFEKVFGDKLDEKKIRKMPKLASGVN